MDKSGKRRPNKGCIGSVISTSDISSIAGFLTGVLRYGIAQYIEGATKYRGQTDHFDVPLPLPLI